MKISSTREFFENAFATSRAGNPKLTIAGYAKRVGLGTSSLKMILSGKRRPTLKQVLLLARAQRLSIAKISYLETLCLKESAASSWERSYYGQILKTKARAIHVETIATSKKVLLENSLAMPVLVDLMESGSSEIDVKFLADRFRAKEETIRALVEKFEREKVLRKAEAGRFHVAFDKLSHRLMQKKFIKEGLIETAKRLDVEYDNPHTLFTTYTFSATEETLLRLQMDLKALMEKYMAEDLSQSSRPREVAQANFQVFSITHS